MAARTPVGRPVYAARVNGVVVRFLEDRFSVRAGIEGRLADDLLAALQGRTLRLLERVDASAWEIETDLS